MQELYTSVPLWDRLLEGSRANLAKIAEVEADAVTSWGKAMGTLNLPCLVSFLMLVEELGRQRSIRPRKIVHDEQGPYQEDYRRAFRLHTEIDRDQRVLIDGMRVPYGAIRAIEDFEIQRSVDQPLLQAADLLAGSISHLSTALIQSRDLHAQEVELGGLILPALLLDGPALALPVCSNRMLMRIGAAIAQAYPATTSVTPKEADDRWPFQWTSTVASGGPLPVLPAPPIATESDRAPNRSIKIDLPLYSIANDSADQLVVLFPHGRRFDESTVYERCVPLWTTRDLAEGFLEEQEWSEPHHIIEFGSKQLPELIERLREHSKWAQMVAFNLFEEDAAPYPITRLADEMERIWERCCRAAGSGIIDVLLKKHEISGQAVVSLLLSSGEYAAMRLSDGLRASGASREEALTNLAALM